MPDTDSRLARLETQYSTIGGSIEDIKRVLGDIQQHVATLVADSGHLSLRVESHAEDIKDIHDKIQALELKISSNGPILKAVVYTASVALIGIVGFFADKF